MKTQKILVGAMLLVLTLGAVFSLIPRRHSGGVDAETLAKVRGFLAGQIKSDCDNLVVQLNGKETKALRDKITGAGAALAQLEKEYVASDDENTRQEIAGKYARTIRDATEAYLAILEKIDPAVTGLDFKVRLMISEVPAAQAEIEERYLRLTEPIMNIMQSVGESIRELKATLNIATVELQGAESAGQEITEEGKMAALTRASTKVLEEAAKAKNDKK